MKYSDIYIEIYADLNINLQTFCLTEEQKEELKIHLERFWRDHCRDALLEEANEKVFQMRIRELVEE